MTSGWCMMLRAILCRSCKEPSPHQPSARGASYSGGRMYITGQGASVRLSDLHTQSLAVWRWRRYQKPQTRNQCAMCAGATRPSPHKLVPQSQCGRRNSIPYRRHLGQTGTRSLLESTTYTPYCAVRARQALVGKLWSGPSVPDSCVTALGAGWASWSRGRPLKDEATVQCAECTLAPCRRVNRA